MKQYLKMADVFPVEIRTDDESGSLICDEDGVILESFSGDKVADYTLHAINSHDELVQMNQELLAALENTWSIIDSAGLYSLVNGVQLGQMSWLAKASDAKSLSEFIIAKAKGGAA